MTVRAWENEGHSRWDTECMRKLCVQSLVIIWKSFPPNDGLSLVSDSRSLWARDDKGGSWWLTTYIVKFSFAVFDIYLQTPLMTSMLWLIPNPHTSLVWEVMMMRGLVSNSIYREDFVCCFLYIFKLIPSSWWPQCCAWFPTHSLPWPESCWWRGGLLVTSYREAVFAVSDICI